ncbi:MAG: LysM peptidoglycan-binding domain-containing protein, partial [Acidobacteriota bacterium]
FVFLLASTASALDSKLFPLPSNLEPNVDFWIKVFAEYDSHHVLLHDERHLQVIYAVLDFTELDQRKISAVRKQQLRKKEITRARTHIRTLLQNLAAGKVSRSHADEQGRIERLFEGISGGRSKYTAATGRLRTQKCLKDEFAAALQRSGIYMAEIENVFRQRGLPIELTRMPFFESLFQWNARSSAQAGGIWQFVPSSARLYKLKMDLEVDERYDPLRATEAAASHLEDNYKSLRTWPLAITGYNHGPAGMRRAVRRLGTRDIGEIVERYRSRTFGFASRNFYAEFIAVNRIYKDRQRYFPDTDPWPALAFDEFRPQLFVPIRDLAKKAGTSIDDLKTMNPALTSSVWAGNVYLPKGYGLRVPLGQGAAFTTAYANLPDDRKSRHQVGHYYRVRRGDTLGKIADKFGTSTSKLQQANKLRSIHRISVGQRLLIPPGSRSRPAPTSRSGQPSTVVAQSNKSGVHIVRRGETLSAIADTYGTSINTLRRLNGLRSANRIYVGQRLKIAGSASRTTHVVRSGETLTSIARRYGTTVGKIKSANSIRSNLIRPRQVLVIP